MGRKMKNAPVYFAIVQVRFNPIADLEEYSAKIQDRFRRQGFPDFRKETLAKINLSMADSGISVGGATQVIPMRRYSFGDIGRTTAFLLDQGALSLQTTEYDVSETFTEIFLEGLRMVHEVVALDYTERVGYRYLDAVLPKTGEQFSDYLEGCLLGLSQKQLGGVEYSFSETRIRMNGVGVIARAIVTPDKKVGVPPDLQPLSLPIAERFSKWEGEHAVIDTDGYYDGRDPFDLATVEKRISSINLAIDKTFKATVTKHAFEVWS
jgi:uncharacterized protein (TIGR04255 family)